MKKTNLMKKLLAAALSLAMALSLAACGGTGTTSNPSTGSAGGNGGGAVRNDSSLCAVQRKGRRLPLRYHSAEGNQ